MSETSLPFIGRVALLDELKNQHDPSDEAVDVLVEALKKPEYAVYFFKDNENPSWFMPLHDRGYLGNALEAGKESYGQHAIVYLSCMSDIFPNEIAELIISATTKDQWMVHRLVNIAKKLPSTKVAGMKPRLMEWVSEQWLITEDIADLMGKLASDGTNMVSALELLGSLLDSSISDRQRAYHMEKVLTVHVREMARSEPQAVLAVLLRALDMCAASMGGRGISSLERGAIEDDSQNRHEHEIAGLIVTAVRDILEEVLPERPNALKPVVLDLWASDKSINRRMAIHTMRLNPTEFMPAIEALADDRIALHDTNLHHEMFLLIRDVFASLDQTVQNRILATIWDGVDTENLQQRLTEWFGRDATGEDMNDYLDRRRLTLLWALRDQALPERERRLMESHLAEHGEPEHPEFLFYIGPATWAEDGSTMSYEEIAGMSPAEVVGVLVESTEVAVDSRRPVSRSLGNSLRKAVTDNATAYSAAAPLFARPDINPEHCAELLRGLAQAATDGGVQDWSAVLSLCERLVDQSRQPDCERLPGAHDWVRLEVARLLGDLLECNEPCLQDGDLLRVRDVLLALADDKDPSPKSEPNDPFTAAINCVRGVALKGLMRYLILKSTDVASGNLTPSDVDPQLLACFDRRLDRSAEYSPAVHSMFGFFLPQLGCVAPGWTGANLVRIFPHSDDERTFWAAAWSGYLYQSTVYDTTYLSLKSEYLYAAERSEDIPGTLSVHDAFPHHIAIVFWRRLEGHEELMDVFLAHASDESRGALAWSLGRGLETVKPTADSEEWQHLHRYWKDRLTQIHDGCAEADSQKELNALVGWLEDVPVPLPEIYPEVVASISLLRPPWYPYRMTEYLLRESQGSPTECIGVLRAVAEVPGLWDQAYWVPQELDRVLESCLSSGDETTYEAMLQLVNQLGELGSIYWLQYVEKIGRRRGIS